MQRRKSFTLQSSSSLTVNSFITMFVERLHICSFADFLLCFYVQTAKEYNTWIKNISTQYDSNTMRLSMYSPWAYDAAWALAIGLNNSMKYMGSNSLEDFSYNRSDIYDSIHRGMNEVLFQGVSVLYKRDYNFDVIFYRIYHF